MEKIRGNNELESDWKADFVQTGREGLSEDTTLSSIMNIGKVGVMHTSGVRGFIFFRKGEMGMQKYWGSEWIGL